MELFGEQGFDDTSVVQIAERSGVTTRTFFRYFSDKREVRSPMRTRCDRNLFARLPKLPTSSTRSTSSWGCCRPSIGRAGGGTSNGDGTP